jgi:hypothetical protein
MARIAPETMTVSLTGTKPIKRMVRRLRALQDVLADHALETADHLTLIESQGNELQRRIPQHFGERVHKQLDALLTRQHEHQGMLAHMAQQGLSEVQSLGSTVAKSRADNHDQHQTLARGMQEALDYLRFGYKQNAESLAKLAERTPEHVTTDDLTSLMAELDASLRAHVDAHAHGLAQRIGELRQEVHSLDSADLNARQLAYQNAADGLRLTYKTREELRKTLESLTGKVGATYDNVMSLHAMALRMGKGVETLLDRQERVAATDAARLVRIEQKIDDLRARTDDAEAMAKSLAESLADHVETSGNDAQADFAEVKALVEQALGMLDVVSANTRPINWPAFAAEQLAQARQGIEVSEES